MLAAVACGQHSPPLARDIVVWNPLGSWSGRGPLQTESFTGETGSLRVRWEAKQGTAPGDGALRVTVHSAISGRPLMEAVDHRGPGAGTAYVNEDPRVFYLVVESENLDWSVAVDEAMAATTTEPADAVGANRR